MAKSTKCSPKLWKKLSPAEQALWKEYFSLFSGSFNFPDAWSDKSSKEQREVVAHNLACQAVWFFKSRVTVAVVPKSKSK